jgi:hypothetical protein
MKQLPMIKSQSSILKKFGAWCLVLGACLLFGAWCLVLPVEGQEATPSSEDRARQILEAVKEKIREKELEPLRKAYVGKLKTISDATLVLETISGIKQAEVSTEAAILRISKNTKKAIEFEDLALGETTIAMGYVAENEVLEAKRVLVSETPSEAQKKIAIYGVVQEIDAEENLIQIKELKSEKAMTVSVTRKTDITTKEDEEIKELDLDEIQPESRALVIAIPVEDEENTFSALRIHITAATD